MPTVTITTINLGYQDEYADLFRGSSDSDLRKKDFMEISIAPEAKRVGETGTAIPGQYEDTILNSLCVSVTPSVSSGKIEDFNMAKAVKYINDHKITPTLYKHINLDGLGINWIQAPGSGKVYYIDHTGAEAECSSFNELSALPDGYMSIYKVDFDPTPKFKGKITFDIKFDVEVSMIVVSSAVINQQIGSGGN